MARASLFVSPAFYEPFGLAVLEAGLSGCALVLSDIPSFRENWRDAAVFVPPGDRRALRLAIEELIENHQLKRALGVRARRRALDFNLRRMAGEYMNAYGQLACAS